MGLFSNFMDSFFFISLGITFVLIFLIVFHFKQRIHFLEKKGDALTDMCNSIIKELGSVKNLCISNMVSKGGMPSTYSFAPPVPNVRTVFSGVVGGSNLPTIPENNISFNKIKVEDLDFDDDDNDNNESEDGSDGDNEEEDSSDDDNNTEYEEENDRSVIEEVKDTEEVELEISEFVLDILEQQEDNKVEEEAAPIIESQHVDDEIKVIQLNLEEDSAIISKTDEDIPSISTVIDNEKSYAKMKVESLRSLILARGLHKDPSKMKRAELVKLLSQN